MAKKIQDNVISDDEFELQMLKHQPNYFIAKARTRYSKGSKARLRGNESIWVTIPKDYRDMKGIKPGMYLKITVEVLTNER